MVKKIDPGALINKTLSNITWRRMR